MVLVFSSNANQSKFVLNEVERALSKGLTIIPFRIEDVLPSKDMEFFVSSHHWLDALTEPLELHINKLADVVVTILSTAPNHYGQQQNSQRPEPVQRPAPVQRPLYTPSPSPVAAPGEIPEKWKKWMKIRQKGKKFFIINYGILGFGGLYGLFMFFVAVSSGDMEIFPAITTSLLIALFAGSLFGAMVWPANEFLYKKMLAKVSRR